MERAISHNISHILEALDASLTPGSKTWLHIGSNLLGNAKSPTRSHLLRLGSWTKVVVEPLPAFAQAAVSLSAFTNVRIVHSALKYAAGGEQSTLPVYCNKPSDPSLTVCSASRPRAMKLSGGQPLDVMHVPAVTLPRLLVKTGVPASTVAVMVIESDDYLDIRQQGLFDAVRPRLIIFARPQDNQFLTDVVSLLHNECYAVWPMEDGMYAAVLFNYPEQSNLPDVSSHRRAVQAATVVSTPALHHHSPHFYHSASLFLKLGMKYETDKVTKHNYDAVYGKYMELIPTRTAITKFLEIGLGCNMGYGPGHSAALWKEYLPNAEVWMAEYNADCVAKHMANLTSLGVKPLVGDQGNITTLRSWVADTGGGFDVIVDDGGHSNMQMLNSFLVLFYHALKPGGLYVIEDLHCSHDPMYNDGDAKHLMMDIVTSWIQQLVRAENDAGPQANVGAWPLPPDIKMIECSRAACVITRCNGMDRACINRFYDASLRQYITGSMTYDRRPAAR